MDFVMGLIIGSLTGVFMMLVIFGEEFGSGDRNDKQ